ncbi:MAG: hypothetical protein JOZ32_13760 [Bryobacterales bacterium]|nr:hypothetical protein [Bryobacterales bacterium]
MDKFTRRELAAALSTSTVLLAGVQSPLRGRTQTPPLPGNSGEELKASLAQLRDNSEQLDKFPLPMSAEPATIFKT